MSGSHRLGLVSGGTRAVAGIAPQQCHCLSMRVCGRVMLRGRSWMLCAL